jgi:hypothetical protein
MQSLVEPDGVHIFEHRYFHPKRPTEARALHLRRYQNARALLRTLMVYWPRPTHSQRPCARGNASSVLRGSLCLGALAPFCLHKLLEDTQARASVKAHGVETERGTILRALCLRIRTGCPRSSWLSASTSQFEERRRLPCVYSPKRRSKSPRRARCERVRAASQL